MVAQTDTEVRTRANKRGSLANAIAVCIANGHTLIDIRDDDWKGHSVPGNIAQCSECLAYLRYYKGKAMGEAFSTTCRENPIPTILGIPVPATSDVKITLKSEIDRASAIIEPYSGYTLNDWAREAHQCAKDKGWWDSANEESRSIGHLIALLHTELSEAYEEYRNGHAPDEIYYNTQRSVYTANGRELPKPEGIPTELVDCMIRIFDVFGYYNIDLESVLIEKHIYNLHRHGGKVS